MAVSVRSPALLLLMMMINKIIYYLLINYYFSITASVEICFSGVKQRQQRTLSDDFCSIGQLLLVVEDPNQPI